MPSLPSRWRLDRRLIVLMIVAACGTSALLAQSGTSDLPFTIQRVVVPPAGVAKELDKVTQGTLQAMPLAEFESRLRQAQKALQSREQKPRLAQAHYSAELNDRSLTNGKGRWSIAHPGPAEAILPIDNLNLALQRLRWDAGGDALLGDFDGESLGLLLKQPGNHQCLFDWSVRGATTGDGLSFVLRVPACPVSSFEFRLPADLWLAAPSSALLVSGPFDTETASKRLWKIQMTGQTTLEFHLRKISDAKGAAPTIFALVDSTHLLTPDRITHEYDINLEILHGSVREIVLEGDADVEPYDITLKSGEIKTWQLKTKKAGASRQLTITLRQPIQGKVNGLKIRAVAPVRSTGLWVSPAMRVRDSLSRGETMKLHLHPDLHVGRWDHGSFQLTNIAAGDNGGQIISLVDAANTPAFSRRPSFLRGAGDVDLWTRETNLWRLDSRGAALAAEWTYAMQRGSLHQLTVQLPSKSLGYHVESVDLRPAELLRGWHVKGEFLTVELKQPLLAAKKATLKLGLRAPFREGGGVGRIVAYPEALPSNSSKREGALAIVIDPIFRSQIISSSVPLARTPAAPLQEKGGEAGGGAQPPSDASYVLTFRDQQVQASLRLLPQPVQVQLRGKQSVVLNEHGASAQFRWEAEPLVGAPAFLDFRCTDRTLASWQVKADDDAMRIHRFERLSLDEALPHLLHFGASPGLGAAALEQSLPTGALWRFHLEELLRKKSRFTLETTFPAGIQLDDWRRRGLMMPQANPWHIAAGALATEMLPKSAGREAWTIPLLIPVQQRNVDHDISITAPHEPIVKAVTQGVSMAGKARSNLEQAPVHSLQYRWDPSFSLRATNMHLWTDPSQSSAAAHELCDEARLTIAARGDGWLSHHVHFRLWHWRGRSCALRFPPETKIVAAKLQDQWLDRLEVNDERDGVTLVVPVDQNQPFVRCEVFARAPTGTSFLPGLGAIPVPKIEWPMQPIDVQTRFFLADGLVPLHQEAMTRVGIPHGLGKQTAALRWLGMAWHWGRSWIPAGDHANLAERLAAQRQTLLNAEKQLRAGAKNELLLSAALERLALQHLKEDTPLIVDRYALQSLGLTPNTAIAGADLNPQATRPFWESLGLVHVACPSGALLTTSRRLEAFGLVNASESMELDAAVVEALRHGRDTSTAFVPAILWASMPVPPTRRHVSETTGFLASDDTSHGGVALWEFLPGEATERVHVVAAPQGRLFGWIVAVLVGLMVWRMQRRCAPLTCLRAYLLAMTVGILLVLWLPITLVDLLTLPALGVAGVGLVWFLFTFALPSKDAAGSTGSTIIKPPAVPSVIALIVLSLLGIPWFSAAQPPALRSYTVLLIEAEGKTTALVPAELVSRLDDIDASAAWAVRNAVVLGAKYTGQVKDQTAAIDAVFYLWSPRDQADVMVPLARVQLHEGALLDDAPALPTVHKNGYLFKVKGKGTHQLRLTFSARVTTKGDYHELAFTAPKLPQCAIALQLPAFAQTVHSLFGCGEESVVDSKKGAKEWQAQLGYEGNVHLRFAAKTADTSRGTEVVEMHYWDLRPGSVSLTSAMTYSIGKGSLSQLVVALPEHLQIRSVEIQAVSASVPGLSGAIKSWQVVGKGPQRRLIADLAQPISTSMRMLIEMVPQFPLPGKLQLMLPTPLQAKSVFGQVGYRTDATDLPTAQNLSVQGIAAEDFAQTWKKQLNQTIMVSRAYRFERRGIPAGLELEIQPVRRQATMRLTWDLEPQHADLSAQCTIASAAENIILQEFAVAANLTLAQVTGPDVAFWNVRDQRLQVWFRRPCKQTSIEITGWHRLNDTPVAPKEKGVNGTRRFIVPTLYPLDAAMSVSTFHVRPAGSITLESDRLQHLQPIAPGPWRYAIVDNTYQAEFRLQTKPAVLEAESLTKLHATEQDVEISCGVRLTTDRGQLPPLKLRLKGWPAGPVTVDAPDASVAPLKNAPPNQHAWTIKHGPGLPHQVLVVVRGIVAKNSKPSFAVPVLELEDVPFAASWLAWKDIEIVDAAGKKIPDALGPLKKGSEAVASATSSLDKVTEAFLSGTWKQAKVTGPTTALMPTSARRSTVQLLDYNEQLASGGDGRWTHILDCLVAVREPTTLRVRFPAPPAHLTVFRDQELYLARPQATNEYFLPLAVAPRPQRLRLTFSYASADGEKPRIDFPVLDASPIAGQPRIAWIPEGMTVAATGWQRRPTFIERLLQQASFHARLSATASSQSADERSKFALDQQLSFYTRIHQAEYLLAVLKNVHPEFDASPFRERMDRLKHDQAKWAQEHGYDAQRALAEKSKALSATPFFGGNDLNAGLPFLPPVGAAQIALQFAKEHTDAACHLHSEIVVLIALALLVFTFVRRMLSILQALAPEVVLAMALALAWSFGLGMIGVVAIASMLLLRLAWLIHGVRSWRSSSPHAEDSTPAPPVPPT